MVILRGEWQQGREGAVVVQAREGLLHKQPVSVWVELLLVKITVLHGKSQCEMWKAAAHTDERQGWRKGGVGVRRVGYVEQVLLLKLRNL